MTKDEKSILDGFRSGKTVVQLAEEYAFGKVKRNEETGQTVNMRVSDGMKFVYQVLFKYAHEE